MSVTIQDDMWRSAEAMKGKQGEAFLLSLVRYGFTGEEPEPDSNVYPMFLLCRDRIDLSVKRSNTGAGRKSKSASRDKSNTLFDSESNQQFDSNQSADGAEINEPDNRDEVSRGEKSRDEVSSADSESSAQVAEVIKHLNEVCGTSYRPTSDTNRKYIGARLSEGYTVDDCKRVIDNMAQAWLNDPKMSQYLRPTTLFRKEKFEGYLNRNGQQRGGGYIADYD